MEWGNRSQRPPPELSQVFIENPWWKTTSLPSTTSGRVASKSKLTCRVQRRRQRRQQLADILQRRRRGGWGRRYRILIYTSSFGSNEIISYKGLRPLRIPRTNGFTGIKFFPRIWQYFAFNVVSTWKITIVIIVEIISRQVTWENIW